MIQQSIKTIIKNIASRLRLRKPEIFTNPDADLDSEKPLRGEEVVRHLGLIADSRPVREYPWWRTPKLVVVVEGTPRRLKWLQEAAPNVELTAVRWGDDMVSAAKEADAVIGWCTDAMLASATNLRWLQLSIAGIETVLQMSQLGKRDILVTNFQRVAGPVIAEHVFAMLLCLARGLQIHLHNQHRRLWSPAAVPAHSRFSLHGRTLLVAGLGGIGTEIAVRAHHFGMRVIATSANTSERPEFVSAVESSDRLVDLVHDADVVVNALPLTPATRNIFNSHIFSAMKHNAIYINVARGASTNTDDLVHALRAGQIAGAALDVTEPEPLPWNHPLWRMKNVIITPHIAGQGYDTQAREWAIMKENLRRYVSGETMLSVVKVNRGY